MPIDNYLALNLAPDGDLARNLFERAGEESRRASLTLTGDGDPGATSANLTPEMASWLGQHIAGRRQAALGSLQTAAREVRRGGNSDGVLVELEEDRFKRERNERSTEETRRFYDANADDIAKLATLQRDYDGMYVEEGDRDAVVPSALAEWGPPFLVAIPEGFMNYGSFVALAKVPVAGLGLTFVAGLAIGTCAWFAGRFLKAWHYYMRADDRDRQFRGVLEVAIAGVILVVLLGYVGYARYQTVLQQAQAAIVLGLTPPNAVLMTALLLTGNLLVFLVGTALTYAMHDENPAFARKAVDLRKARRRHEGARGRLDARLNEIGRAYHQKRDAMLKRVRSLMHEPAYGAVLDDLGRFNAKDEEVLGLLRDYRSRLISLIEPRDPDFRFAPSTVERQAGAHAGTISLAEFAGSSLQLYKVAR